MLATRGLMAHGRPWLMSSGNRCTLVVKANGRWERTMEGEWGITLNLQLQNRTTSICVSIYVGISYTILSSRHVQPDQNNTRIILYGATLNIQDFHGKKMCHHDLIYQIPMYDLCLLVIMNIILTVCRIS